MLSSSRPWTNFHLFAPELGVRHTDFVHLSTYEKGGSVSSYATTRGEVIKVSLRAAHVTYCVIICRMHGST